MQIPWLDVLFNSDDPLPARLKALKCDSDEVTDTALTATNARLSLTSSTLRSVSFDENYADIDDDEQDDDAEIDVVQSEIAPDDHYRVPLSAWRRASHPNKLTGSASPLSDSGCTSESHDEFSLASLNSAQSSPHLAALQGRLETRHPQQQDRVRIRRGPQEAPINRSATSAGGGWRFGRIAQSLRTSISKFADKSEWKMEALAARQREARALVLLNETQAEVTFSII